VRLEGRAEVFAGACAGTASSNGRAPARRYDKDDYFGPAYPAKRRRYAGIVNVWPPEVEGRMHHSAETAGACPIDAPDNLHGEEGRAVVGPRPNAALLVKDTIIGWCHDDMGEYKSTR